ncbi:hypothetical protein NOF04DRAFT_5208 [Fusarium oxysporum II5]|uniref:Uncharacterized protein n=1 Tax=Fusarium odoratissimum (strain NRRL 54006) TaxID=1089451 RepID=X0KS60_FUSO5|nr:uncharacterized protein FOIG_08637 [Fusarium odoratissimum NRRL 54006]EXL99614.1 hypothetical protein FOIG_08637 [Fusarium odoratissimum NRRL 54006]KAK2125107.1 hypothetical protein NOF04DRAFT_5208 [Fusarium oxysporum II5]
MPDFISGYKTLCGSWLEQPNVIVSREGSSQLRRRKKEKADWIWTCCSCRTSHIESSMIQCTEGNKSRCQCCEVEEKSESERVKDNRNLQQSPELTEGMLKILNDIYADPEKIGAKSLVGWFMTNGGKEPRRRYQAEVVNHFCHSNELQELQSNSSNISSRKSCLIDDRTSNGIVSTSNGDRKPLTSHGMYIRLVEKVDLSASQIEHQW